MRALAAFVMRGRSQAILVAAASALLALAVPPLMYIGGAVVALAVLRQGAREGALVAVGAMGVMALSGLIAGAAGPAAAGFAGMFWLPLWVVALSLRNTVDLGRSLVTAGAFGAGLVLALRISVADLPAMWRPMVEESLGPLLTALGVEDVGAVLDSVAALMTGLLAAALVMGLVISLLLARWWQAMLYNPGGFRDEFHRLRLGRGGALLTLGLMALAALGPGSAAQLGWELAVGFMALFLVQGLAVAHGVAGIRKAPVAWLVGLYVVTFVVLPQLAVLLVLLGLTDAWIDFRGRAARR